MARVILLASFYITGLFAQRLEPQPQGLPRKLTLTFTQAAVIKIDSTATYYEYTVETGTDGYLVRSRRRIVITEGAHVKVAVEGQFVYITDEDGKAQQTTGVLQYRLPARLLRRKLRLGLTAIANVRYH